MGDCNFNSTCTSCTTGGMEYVETEENLVCCVDDSNSILGWIKFVAKAPTDCRPSEVLQRNSLIAGLAISGLFILFGVAFYIFRRVKANGYTILGEGTPGQPERGRNGQHETGFPSAANWEEVELESVMASMEATTVL